MHYDIFKCVQKINLTNCLQGLHNQYISLIIGCVKSLVACSSLFILFAANTDTNLDVADTIKVYKAPYNYLSILNKALYKRKNRRVFTKNRNLISSIKEISQYLPITKCDAFLLYLTLTKKNMPNYTI